ncbi:MAG: sulfatase [Planctomycetes bacterium]|nr:sulfatase [Planctomycetota bacterium]
MDRRTLLRAGAAGAAVSLAGSLVQGAEKAPAAAAAPARAAAPAARPNVIWVFGDQHPAHALSCMGDPNVSTPNLDRLAAEGVHFTDALSGFPLCCPFRGSLIASRYPHLCVPGHEYPLPPGTPTIVQPLKAAGYHTGYFGKWHLDGWHERDGRAAKHIVPPERRCGFDVWVGYENNNAQYDSWVHGGEGDKAFHYKLPGYETDCLTDLFIGYLKDRAKESADGRTRPFFAVLSVQPPHDPYVAPPEYMAKHKAEAIALRPNVPDVKRVVEQARKELAGAYAQIENLDSNVGRIRKALAEAGLAQNTYILFFSDHGDMHGAHGQFRKTSPWEESIRIPFIIAGGPLADKINRGKDRAPVNTVDIAPTTLGLLGLPKPDWMQGTDYSSHFLPGAMRKDDPDSAFIQAVVPTGHGDSVDRPWRGIVARDGWKYVCLEGQPWMLFNLSEDPYEMVNLAHNTKFKGPRKRLHDRLTAWIEKTGDKFDLPKL